jgi:hypothetical protein
MRSRERACANKLLLRKSWLEPRKLLWLTSPSRSHGCLSLDLYNRISNFNPVSQTRMRKLSGSVPPSPISGQKPTRGNRDSD